MATDATLTTRERNRILELVNEYGPPPTEFQWSEKRQEEWSGAHSATYRVSVLTHRPTGYYCIFGAHTVTVSPGWSRKIQWIGHEDSFGIKEDFCAKWLVLAKAEAETPDLWASIIDEKSLSKAASSTVDNQPFTLSEQNLIATKLDEIKGHILEGQGFAADQAEFVEERFAYFKESSTRMGRKDWLNVLYGGLITVIVGVALAPDVAKSLLRLAATAFQSLWGMAQGYLP